MKKRDAYHPDYLKIYPCLKDRPDILKFLRQCDRKQEYLEYDLKVNRIRKSERTMETVVMPQKEDSYERLLEEHQQFSQKFLLHLRYWCELSQVEIARQLGTTQQSVSYQERCVLRKLKKLLKN